MLEFTTKPELKELLSNSYVTGLNYSIIKSCSLTQVWTEGDTVQINERGIEHDREFLVVAASPFKNKRPGDFLTQRELPRMALINPQITDHLLILSAPDMPGLEIPIQRAGPEEPVVVWRDTILAINQGDQVQKWLSEFLETNVKLVRMSDNFVRKAGSYRTHDKDQVGFADGYPFLVISEESLNDLNRRLAQLLPMNRFRPNIVISGSGISYGEDFMSKLRIGNVTFNVVKPCIRCVITTTDQNLGVRATGEMKGEPLKTLASYRTTQVGNDRGAIFGQNLTHESTGRIKIGDKIEVLETKAWPNFVS